MAITATKDCKGCEQDRTIIYALLSKEPIIDIHSINKSQLASIIGGEPTKPSSVKTKGISMDLDIGNRTDNSNVNIGVLEFFVSRGVKMDKHFPIISSSISILLLGGC